MTFNTIYWQALKWLWVSDIAAIFNVQLLPTYLWASSYFIAHLLFPETMWLILVNKLWKEITGLTSRLEYRRWGVIFSCVSSLWLCFTKGPYAKKTASAVRRHDDRATGSPELHCAWHEPSIDPEEWSMAPLSWLIVIIMPDKTVQMKTFLLHSQFSQEPSLKSKSITVFWPLTRSCYFICWFMNIWNNLSAIVLHTDYT